MSRSARHTAILALVTLCGCLAAFGGWRFARASAPVNGPIILITVDALRADHLPVYGYAGVRTPAIDQLSADAVVFERAYAHVPQTWPAHASILTGRLPFETGVRDVAGYTLPGQVRTVAEMLRDRGYATGGIVSSYLLRRETGIDRGFSFFDDELPPVDAARPDAWLTRDAAATEAVAEHWLESAGTSRVFLFLHLSSRQTGPGPDSAPSSYDAGVGEIDASIGRLMQYLKAHQLYDRSTVLLVADHGQGLGDGGEVGHGLLLTDAVLRVPLVIKAPAGDGRPGRISAPVQQIDLVPTILDLAKAPGSSGLRGRTLAGAMKGASLTPSVIYAETMFGAYRFGWTPTRSLITDSHQLLVDGDAVRLFDVTLPAASRTDLAPTQTAVVSALQDKLGAFEDAGSTGAAAPVTEADRERFEALGYVGDPGVRVQDSSRRRTSSEGAAFVETYRSAVQLAGTERWQEAVDRYRQLTSEQPDRADVWMHLARLEARHERHDEALEAFRQVLALDPSDVSAQLGAGWSLLRVRKLDDADDLAKGVIADASAAALRQAEAHELRARVALNRKDIDTARTEAEAAERADAERPVSAFVKGRLALDEGAAEDAVAAFDEALRAATKHGRAPLADLRVYAAEALTRVGRAEDAERLLQAELQAFPANARARSLQQTLRRESGRAQGDAASRTQH